MIRFQIQIIFILARIVYFETAKQHCFSAKASDKISHYDLLLVFVFIFSLLTNAMDSNRMKMFNKCSMCPIFKGRQLSNYLIRINLEGSFFPSSYVFFCICCLLLVQVACSSRKLSRCKCVRQRNYLFIIGERGEYHYTMSTMLHSIWRSIDALQFMLFNLIYSLHWQHYLHKIYIDGDNLIIISEWTAKWHRRLIIIFTCEHTHTHKHMHMVGENTIYAIIETNRMQQWTRIAIIRIC